MPIHHFSSIDAPPGPSSHVQGNPRGGSGGATPGQRRTSKFVLSSLHIENVRVLDNRTALAGGPAAPRSPRRLRLVGVMDDRLSGPSVPSCPGQSCAGARACNPRQSMRGGRPLIVRSVRRGRLRENAKSRENIPGQKKVISCLLQRAGTQQEGQSGRRPAPGAAAVPQSSAPRLQRCRSE